MPCPNDMNRTLLKKSAAKRPFSDIETSQTNCDQNNRIVPIELPVRHLFHFLDGPTNGPIGKEVYIRSLLCGSCHIQSVKIGIKC